MDITKLNDSEFADLAINLVDLLGGTELSAIDSHVRAALVTELGTLPADFAAQLSAAEAVNDEKISATSTKDTTRDTLTFIIRKAIYALKSGGAPKSQFDLARFTFPEKRSSKYVAKTPTEMAAVGFSNGVNEGTFKGNNKSGLVTYEIWRREGDEGPWQMHLLTKKQFFKDQGVTPGQYYEYRARARAAQTESDFSNSTVVYGVL